MLMRDSVFAEREKHEEVTSELAWILRNTRHESEFEYWRVKWSDQSEEENRAESAALMKRLNNKKVCEWIFRTVWCCAQDFWIYSKRRSDNSSLLPWTLNKMDLKKLNLLFSFEFSLSQLFENSAESKSPPQVTPPVSRIQSRLNKERRAPVWSGTVRIKLARREAASSAHRTGLNTERSGLNTERSGRNTALTMLCGLFIPTDERASKQTLCKDSIWGFYYTLKKGSGDGRSLEATES